MGNYTGNAEADFEETALMPSVVADTVASDIANALQKPEASDQFAQYLMSEFQRVYQNNQDWAEKIVADTERSRASLYGFMTHWAASFAVQQGFMTSSEAVDYQRVRGALSAAKLAAWDDVSVKWDKDVPFGDQMEATTMLEKVGMKKKGDFADTPNEDYEGQKRNDFKNKALNSAPSGPKDQSVLDQWKDCNGQSLEVGDKVKVSGSFSESNIGEIAGQDSNGFPWVKFNDGTEATMIGMNLIKVAVDKKADEKFAPGDKVLYDYGYKTIPVVIDQVDGDEAHVKAAEGQFWTTTDKLIRIPEGGFQYNENPDFGFAE